MGGRDKSLRTAVAALLADERTNAVAAVVQDLRGRRERDRAAAVEEPPTDVDVVARRAVDRVEAANLLEVPAAEGHIAARYVFCPLVGEQDLHGAARGRGDRPFD